MLRYKTNWIKAALIALPILLTTAIPALAQDGSTDPNSGNTVKIVQIDTSHFPQITVWVSVTDAAGNPVGTVPADDFVLTENGQPVQITEVYQAGEQGPVSAVLTIDRSGSMLEGGKMDAAKAAANKFIDLMRPEDKTGVIVFNTEVQTVQPLTNDKDALHNAINGIQAFEDTAMYDGLMESAAMLRGVEGRRVIIMLSDGMDNSSQSASDDTHKTVVAAEASVYDIGAGARS